MNRLLGLVALGVVWMGAMGAEAQAATAPPQITSARVDYIRKTLTVFGKNFGNGAVVSLGSIVLPTQSSASTRVISTFPADRAPSSIAPGTYVLSLVTGGQGERASFMITLGAAGPAGPPGAGVDDALLQQIADLQAQVNALRNAVVANAGGSVQLRAESSLDVLAGANKSETVGATSTLSVGASRIADVGASDTLSVSRDQDISVGADQSVLVGGTQGTVVAVDQTLEIDGKQTVKVDGDQSVTIGGNVVQSTGKTLQIRGRKNALISMDLDGNISIQTDGDIQMVSGDDILIKASGDITLLGQHVVTP
jgi:type VI secretion system secreted protein VgrG